MNEVFWPNVYKWKKKTRHYLANKAIADFRETTFRLSTDLFGLTQR